MDTNTRTPSDTDTTGATGAAAATSTNDPRPLLAAALDQTGRLIQDTDAVDLARPTPCAEWDVAALVSHQVAVVTRIGAVLGGAAFDSVPRQIETDDYARAWNAARAATDQVLADDACLTGEVTVPWGTVPAAAAAESYVSELATHAWDLAVATGRVDQLDPALAQASLPVAMAKVPAHIRGLDGIPFSAVVEVDAAADPYTRLVAWNGRDPRWTP